MSGTLLIDGDGLIYRCGFAVEKTKYLVSYQDEYFKEFDGHKGAALYAKEIDGQIWSRKEVEPVENAYRLVDITINKICKRFPDYEDVRIITSPPAGNFRDRIARTARYKGNRDGAQKPRWFHDLREYLKSTYSARDYDGAEADDGLCVAAWTFLTSSRPDSFVVCSLDKDLDQIPGLHYNWVTEEVYKIGKKEGDINLYAQMLSGDPTDNIPGLEGIGPVKARQILKACTSTHDCWKAVRDAYRDRYGEAGEERALETARLVYLQRKEGELWEPPILS